METTFRLNIDDLNQNFLESIKNLFHSERELEIVIKPSCDFDLNLPESNQEYESRLLKAIENIENKKNIEFTHEEFVNYSNNLLKEFE